MSSALGDLGGGYDIVASLVLGVTRLNDVAHEESDFYGG